MLAWTKQNEKRILEVEFGGTRALNEPKQVECSNQLGGFTESVNHEPEPRLPEFLPQEEMYYKPPIEMLYCMISTK